MMYSDNKGTSWDTLAINQYLITNWMNQKQIIKGMISKGNNITLMRENDVNGSHPDVMKSIDGGQTFTVDTIGLAPNAFGGVMVRRFHYFNNKLYFAPNYDDIYTQGEGVTGIAEIAELDVKLYPNPFTSVFKIESDFSITSIQVLNMMGKVVKIATPNTNTFEMNLEELASGIYVVQIQANNQMKTVKIIKE